jgi:hypothetical protein
VNPLDFLSIGTTIVNKLLDYLPEGSAEKAKAQAEAQAQLLALSQQINSAQLDVDKTEASTNNLFIGGWRSAIGWVGAAALAYQYLVRPIMMFALPLAGVHVVVPMPGLDDNLWQLILGMLGMGGLHSYDKMQAKK